MAKTVFMSTEGMEVYNEQNGPVFEVKEAGKLVGRLTVSKGGVRWAPVHNRGEPHFASWNAFDEFMKSCEKR